MKGVPFARRVFTVAAIYGIIVLAPQYFMEERIGMDYPPPLTHPEHFYGFIGLALVWQFAFLLIASNPMRYRPLMLIAVFEKLAWAVPCIVLYARGRLAGVPLATGLVDLTLGVLFLATWFRTPPDRL